MKLFLLIAFAAVLFTGCATPEIVRMDGDTYFIQKRSAQVGFGPPEGAKAEVYEVANKFCEARDMALETVKFTMVNSGFGRPGSVALQFRCVPRTAAQSDASIQSSTATSDVEKRLRALNELKQRGLLTEEEFQKKRSEIINSL
jgi:hypothetical protein